MGPEATEITDNGVFYTPDEVAATLVAKALEGVAARGMTVLDPACGEGALLRAAAAACDEMLPANVARTVRFTGCDLFSPSSWPDDKRFTFSKCDFFGLDVAPHYNAIVMNPPYIQYGRISAKNREEHYRTLAGAENLWRNLDLWTYFILKALRHLTPGGTLAAVVPWSLVEAQYAHAVRQLLADRFGLIRVLVLRDRHFDSTEKRVLLLWLKEFGTRASKIDMAFSGTVTDKHVFSRLARKEWESSDLLAVHGLKVAEALRDLKDLGFRHLSDYADVTIGVVTGANEFFIVPTDTATQSGFSEASTVPILTHVSELRDLSCASSPPKVLLRFFRMTERRRKYLRSGKRKKVHRRSHCERRVAAGGQWYEVDTGVVPDAFFTYRVSNVPFMVLNPNGYQCTNTLHKICFKKTVGKNARQWIQLCLLSTAGQLSLEAGARHYGNGILKVEPYLLKKAMVFASSKPVPTDVYRRASEAIAAGDKGEASVVATEALRPICGGSERLWSRLTALLKEIRHRRNGIE